MIVNRRNLFRIWSDYAGVTLLEVLVALVLLGLLAGSMLHISGVAGRWTEEASRQNQAAALAFGILEYCRAVPDWVENGPYSGDDARQLWSSDPVNRALYPWQADVEPCDGEAQLWQVRVRVNWDGGSSEKAVEMCTLLYRPREIGSGL